MDFRLLWQMIAPTVETIRRRHMVDELDKSLERLLVDDEDTTTLDLTTLGSEDDVGYEVDDILAITHALKKTSHLRTLAVDVERADCEHIRKLTSAVRRVSNLRTLRLYTNRPPDMVDHQQARVQFNVRKMLKRINSLVRSLQLDRVTVAPSDLCSALASLQVLHLHNCLDNTTTSFSSICMIGQAMARSTIQELKVHGMDGRSINAPLVRAMANHPTLTKLSVDCLDQWSAKAVRDVLDSRQTKLERLELVDSLLTKTNFSFIVEGLIINRTVQVLIIYRCGIPSDSAQLLPKLLRSKNTTLTHLEVEQDGAMCCSCDAYDAVLAASVRHTVLKTLILKGFTAQETTLQDFVARNRSVTHFSIARSIGSINFFCLSDGLLRMNSSTTLKKLDLSRCGLEDWNMSVLASGLVRSAVTILNLAENDIIDASPLAICTTLREIDLTWNDIDDDGVVHLAGMAPRLERLIVDCCLIGVRGFRLLLTAPFRALFCRRLELTDDVIEKDHELNRALIELLPVATVRSLEISVGSNRLPRFVHCSQDDLSQILHAFTKSTSFMHFCDYDTWFKTAAHRRTVDHVMLRNSVAATYPVAIVPTAWHALLLRKPKAGASLIFRTLRDHPEWITRRALLGQQEESEHEGRVAVVDEPQPARKRQRKCLPPSTL